jgi:hypothetical protein
MTLTDILNSVKFVVNPKGKKSAVLVDIDIWEQIVTLLEDIEDVEEIKKARMVGEETVSWNVAKKRINVLVTSAINSVIEMLEKLPESKQEQVVVHLRTYLAENRTTHPKGNLGKKIVRFAGAISKQDLLEMEKAIEAGCEQVDINEW